mmetsp:Transcript_24345/g.30967  ORF Transcript_24345/g.30967 Transcript_24345/m.30967 type:complete len:738 (-) Transcript_24345:344-2557(-)
MAQPPSKPTVNAAMPAKPTFSQPRKSTILASDSIKKEEPEDLDPTVLPLPAKPTVDLSVSKKKIVDDLVQFENDVTNNLQVIIETFYQPLLAAAETDVLPSVSKVWIKQIFMNSEQIHQMNKQVQEMLVARVGNWDNVQRVGDIFIKMLPYLKIYLTYAANFNRSQEVFEHCNQDFQFQKHLEKMESAANAQLEELLNLPLTIIASYSQILTDLLTKTEAKHPDSNDLTTVINHMEQLIGYITKNTDASRVQAGSGHRKLIHEGSVLIREAVEKEGGLGTIKKKFQKGGASKEARLHIYLFNDVLVHMKTSRKRPGATKSGELTWPLNLVWFQDIKELDQQDPKNPHTFYLIGPGKCYTMRFAELHEKMTWQNRIRDAIEKKLTEENSGEDGIRFGTYKFPDKEAGEYEGWWKFGKIHGEGVYKFCGNTYTGAWNFNKKEGTGTMECVSGEVYHGEWLDDRPNGYGQLQYINRDRYDGEWKEGMRSGRGCHYFSNGDKYDGEWSLNLCHGEGIYTTHAGHFYCGTWKSGKMHGYGLLVTPNGRRYEGQFLNGQRSGEGKLDYGNGDFYIGQWLDNRKQGKGLFHSSTEGVYDGFFVGDQKEGLGVMHYSSGDIYDGQWKKNQPNGSGVMHYCSGGITKYDGQWENGLMNGKGTIFYKSGAKYEGHVKDGILHGHGKYIHDNAVVYDGQWKDGMRDGKATMSVGPSKFQSTCVRGLMAQGKQVNFLVVPDIPQFHFEL